LPTVPAVASSSPAVAATPVRLGEGMAASAALSDAGGVMRATASGASALQGTSATGGAVSRNDGAAGARVAPISQAGPTSHPAHVSPPQTQQQQQQQRPQHVLAGLMPPISQAPLQAVGGAAAGGNSGVGPVQRITPSQGLPLGAAAASSTMVTSSGGSGGGGGGTTLANASGPRLVLKTAAASAAAPWRTALPSGTPQSCAVDGRVLGEHSFAIVDGVHVSVRPALALRACACWLACGRPCRLLACQGGCTDGDARDVCLVLLPCGIGQI
jgi:hypothetical protein